MFYQLGSAKEFLKIRGIFESRVPVTTAEDQGLGGCNGDSNQGSILIKIGSLRAIELSGSKLGSRIPRTRWVGSSERSGERSIRG